eukprot:TRINITY_DN3539_c0_g1_i1.p1 TRINITY_DN3539_c0_g1~~TRINITY_DN3539_c0_g1_i1.p1  ORF type:complete len:645 (+),score=186.29 TRINITY_DN3539_c0_g1_i1:86-2020(+)
MRLGSVNVGTAVLTGIVLCSLSFILGFQVGGGGMESGPSGGVRVASVGAESPCEMRAEPAPASPQPDGSAAVHYCLAVQSTGQASTRALLYSLIDALAYANQNGRRVNVTVLVADMQTKRPEYISALIHDPFLTTAQEEQPFAMLAADLSDFDRALYRTEAVKDEGYTQLQYLMDKYIVYPDGGLATECEWVHFTKGEAVFSPRFLHEIFVSPKPALGSDDDSLMDNTGAIDPKTLGDAVLFSFVGMHPAESRDGLRRRHQAVQARAKYGGLDLLSVVYRVEALRACTQASFVQLPTDPAKVEVMKTQGLGSADWHMFKRMRKSCHLTHHVLPGVLALKQDKELAYRFPLPGDRQIAVRNAPNVCLAVHMTPAEAVTTEALLANIVSMVEVTNPSKDTNVHLKVILTDASTEYWGSETVPQHVLDLANLAMLKKAKRKHGLTVHTPRIRGLQMKDMARKDSDRRYVLSQRVLDEHILPEEGRDVVGCDYVMFIHNPLNRFNPYFLNETMVNPRPLSSTDSQKSGDTDAPVVRHSKLGDAILFDFITAKERGSNRHGGRRTASVQEAELTAMGVDVSSVLYKVSILRHCTAVKFKSIVDVVAEQPELLLEPPQVLLAQQGWRFLKDLIAKCSATTSILPAVLYVE